MKDNFSIHKWNKQRYLNESKIDEVEMPNIPDQVFTKFATQIKNPQTFASAILALVSKLSEKENDNLLKNPKLKRAFDLLTQLSGEKQEAGEVEEAMLPEPGMEDSREVDMMLKKMNMAEGTDLYDKNGILMTRYYGGEGKIMLQVNYGGKYIQIPADEIKILRRAIDSIEDHIYDMTISTPVSEDEMYEQTEEKELEDIAKQFPWANDVEQKVINKLIKNSSKRKVDDMARSSRFKAKIQQVAARDKDKVEYRD